MTGRLRRAEILAVILLLGPSAAYAAGLLQTPQEVQPIDRWLVSSPFPTDGGGGDSPLTGPGEEGVLPDRGQELAGSTWTLVRIDGRSELRLDTLFPDRSPPEFVYSHAYLRLQRDRTIALVIEGLGDGRLRTWVNGRVLKTADGAPLEVTEADTVRVRLGAGWNTLLVRAEGGGEGFGLAAGLAARDGGPPVRVQASRPPGDVRT